MAASAVRRVAVTGLGLVTPWGVGGRDLGARLRRELPGASPAGAVAGADLPVAGFEVAAILGAKGHRHLTRGTLYLLAAARLALEDAGLSSGGEGPAGAGVAAGTVTGTAALVAEFDRTTLREGPQAVNPGVFPQTVWNSPPSHAAIRFGLGGPNLTVATGHTSGLDAVLAAADLCREGRAPLMLAGGFEELTPLFRVLFPGPPARPLRLAEGAALLVLEEAGAAEARGATPLAFLPRGWTAFDPGPAGSGPGEELAGAAGRITRSWRVDLGDSGEAAQDSPGAERVELVRVVGAGGGFGGALAAALAAAPGEGTGVETVLADDDAGQRSFLPVDRR